MSNNERDAAFELLKSEFIDTLLDMKPNNPDITDKMWLEHLFAVKYYPIKKYEVIRTFDIIGKERVDGVRTTPGSMRWADKGNIVWIRVNDTRKEKFEAEIELDLRKRPNGVSFIISKKQYKRILPCLKEIS